MRRVPIGISDFREIREAEYVYIDKTELIREVIDASAQVLLFPRPRRFGKTLNLSMLRYFLERSDEDRSGLFEGLSVFREHAQVSRPHFQRHPVIFLSFKDVKEDTFAACLEKVKVLVGEAYRSHFAALTAAALTPGERERIVRIVDGNASQVECENALRHLSAELRRVHAEQVVILIDEYDTPIQAGFFGKQYDDIANFFRNFLSGGLKDNAHLYKGVLTGVLRLAKESMFSGLNNIIVYSMLRTEFATRFGFTEEEVQSLAAELGQDAYIEEIRAWYNGYIFGRTQIYNPWSVLNFLASEDKQYRPHWASTSSDELLRKLLLDRGAGLEGELEALLHSVSVEKPVEEHTALRDIEDNPEAVWSLLLMSGYLKAEGPSGDDLYGTPLYRLSIPNHEVRGIYRNLLLRWLEQGAGSRSRVSELVNSLLQGEAEQFERLLGELVERVLSYHDTAGREPERVFQAFILGLLTTLEPRYDVRSNRESGRGRYDVMVLPREAGQPGVVLELKVVNARRGEKADEALAGALRQIALKDYASELRARGAGPIHEVAAVLDGKLVKAARAPSRS